MHVKMSLLPSPQHSRRAELSAKREERARFIILINVLTIIWLAIRDNVRDVPYHASVFQARVVCFSHSRGVHSKSNTSCCERQSSITWRLEESSRMTAVFRAFFCVIRDTTIQCSIRTRKKERSRSSESSFAINCKSSSTVVIVNDALFLRQ